MINNFSKSKIFLFSLISFIVGIGTASFLPEKFLHYDLVIFGAVISLVVIIILLKKKYVLKYVFLLLFFTLGIWRVSIALPSNTSDKIWHYNGQEVSFIGIVNKEPDERVNNQKLTVETRYIASLPVSGNVLVTTRLYPQYNYGDILEINCKLQAPEPFAEFSYDRYLARYNIYSVCYYPQISPVGAMRASPLQNIYAKILNVKSKLKESINYGLLEPESSLLSAILLGNRRGLDADLLNVFSRAGISHVVAISGMHIAIIAMIILNVLLALGLSRKQSFIFSSLILIIYIILVGLPASAVRASFMAILVMLAVFLGRLNKITNSLVLAAAVLLLINPKLLRDDIGFQLSFLAVLGIVYVKPIIDHSFAKATEGKSFTEYGVHLQKGMAEIISVTLAAQVFTLPLIALYFHQVSIVSPLVNLLVLPLLPFVMVLGILASILSIFFINLSWLVFTPVYFLLKYIIWVAGFSAQLPLAYIEIGYVWPGFVVLAYIFITVIIIWYNKRKLT